MTYCIHRIALIAFTIWQRSDFGVTIGFFGTARAPFGPFSWTLKNTKGKLLFRISQKYLKSTDIFVHRINFDLKKKVEKFFNTKARVMVKFLEVEKWEIFHFLGVTNWNNLRTQNIRQFMCIIFTYLHDFTQQYLKSRNLRKTLNKKVQVW